MRRIHLLEIEDQPWCPRAIRDGGTDWLRFTGNLQNIFAGIAPKLREAMQRSGSHRIVDLCSGGGGPWLNLERTLAASGEVEVLLTDLYPNVEALRFVQERSAGSIRYHPDSVDATNVPEHLDGVRTMFNAFHHFPPDKARAILADAVRKRRPIGIFEACDNRLLGIAMVLSMSVATLLLTPFIRPFRLSRLLLTYALPAIPALVLFDGTVSMLRIYSPAELREMVERIPGHESFEWDIGTQPIPRAPIGLTYLVGMPR